MTKPIHLHPTAPLAERVLLPGDPGRALRFAQSLLADPVMFNHHRGLWGYTGTAADGEQMTIQSTGMGGPSAAIVVAELAELGARRLLRAGTCGALGSDLGLGDLLVVTEAIPEDGTSRALAGTSRLRPDEGMARALLDAAPAGTPAGAVVSTDLFYDGPEGRERAWLDAGAAAVEMETATLLALAGLRGLRAASLLLVSDLLAGGRTRIAPEDLQAGEERLARVAAQALSG